MKMRNIKKQIMINKTCLMKYFLKVNSSWANQLHYDSQFCNKRDKRID